MAKTKTSFKKGEGGRRKGVPNKATQEIREVLVHVLQGREKSIQAALDSLEGKDYIDAVSKLLPYVVARKTDITSDDKQITINLGTNYKDL